MGELKKYWRKSDIDLVKANVKQEISAAVGEDTSSIRLDYILKRISELAKSEVEDDLLYQLIFTVSALYHHSRFGGLTDKKIKRLEQLAFDILQLAGVKPIRSRLAFLYGELYLVMSQIDRLRGLHWRSAWQQQIASYFSGTSQLGENGFQNLSLAIRMDRLGNLGYSIDLNKSVFEDKSVDTKNRIKAGLGLIRGYRLTNDLDSSKKIAHILENNFDIGADTKLELQWESACRDTVELQNPLSIISLTRTDSSHYRSVYILEMTLWVLAMKETRFQKHLPSLSYLHRKKNLDLQSQGILFEATKTLMMSYDFDVSLPVRLREISSIITRSDEFITIEQQLLFTLAVIRFLVRAKLQSMADLCSIEYSKTILNYNSRISDPLGIGKDILERFKL